MSDGIYDKIFELIITNFLKRHIKSVEITWFGGEPLLEKKRILEFHRKLEKFIDKKRINVGIITNGILLSRDFLFQISKYALLTHIQITIDGKKNIHNRKRKFKDGDGTYDLIINKVNEIKKLTPLNLRINVDKQSIEGINELFEDFIKNEFHKEKNIYVNFGHLRKFTDHVIEDSHNFFTFNEYTRNQIELTKKLKYYGFKTNLYPSLFSTCMFAQVNSFVIDPKGDLYKCWDMPGVKKYTIGNIETFSTLKYKPFYYSAMSYNPIDFVDCKKCKHLPTCLGGCPAIRMGFSAIDPKDNLCDDMDSIIIQKLQYKIEQEEKK